MTSLPVMIESSTISPSQPEPCGPFLVFNKFFFVELLSVFPSSLDSTVTTSDCLSIFFSSLSSLFVVFRFGGISSSVSTGIASFSECSGIWSGSQIEISSAPSFSGDSSAKERTSVIVESATKTESAHAKNQCFKRIQLQQPKEDFSMVIYQ